MFYPKVSMYMIDNTARSYFRFVKFLLYSRFLQLQTL